MRLGERALFPRARGEACYARVLLLEGMAQTADARCMHHLAVHKPPLIYFMGIDKARLCRPVVPGDVVYYYVEKIQSRGSVWRCRGRALVEGAISWPGPNFRR